MWTLYLLVLFDFCDRSNRFQFWSNLNQNSASDLHDELVDWCVTFLLLNLRLQHSVEIGVCWDLYGSRWASDQVHMKGGSMSDSSLKFDTWGMPLNKPVCFCLEFSLWKARVKPSCFWLSNELRMQACYDVPRSHPYRICNSRKKSGETALLYFPMPHTALCECQMDLECYLCQPSLNFLQLGDLIEVQLLYRAHIQHLSWWSMATKWQLLTTLTTHSPLSLTGWRSWLETKLTTWAL